MQKLMLKMVTLICGLGVFTGSATELNSSIFFFNQSEIDDCERHIERAKAFGNSKAHFVYTFHFIGDIEANTVDYFCFWRNGVCEKLTEEFTAEIHSGLKRCFKKAFDEGLDVAFLAHVDNGGDGSYWRNQLVFDPKVTYGGTSYYTNHLKPMANFIAEITPADRSVDWVLVGEMGATIFHFAESYREILRELRTQLLGKKVKMGVGLNHNRIGGDNFQYSVEQLSALEELLKEIDFLGISAYKPHDINALGPDSFYANITSLKRELTNYGVRLNPRKDIHFSEVGLGGAKDTGDGYAVAEEAWEAVDFPWAGIGAPYDINRDPWQNEELKAVRKKFHAALLELLADQENRRHKITGAFLWSSSSWDVQGFNYPEFGDAEIKELIRAHNEAQ